MSNEFVNKELTECIIGCAIRVHKAMGVGLLESVYEACLAYELVQAGKSVVRQREVPVTYGTVTLDCGFRADLIVDDLVLVELKCVQALAPIHETQLLTYMRLTNLRVGLLINFYVPQLTKGIVRRVL